MTKYIINVWINEEVGCYPSNFKIRKFKRNKRINIPGTLKKCLDNVC